MYNRRERRKMEKDLGFFKEVKNMTTSQKEEFRKRKQEAGKQIFLKNLEDATNRMTEVATDRIAKQIQGLVESGMSEADANKFVEANIAREDARAEKLAARRERQQAKIK